MRVGIDDEKIKKICGLDKTKVGFNNNDYDDRILARAGFPVFGDKLDLLPILYGPKHKRGDGGKLALMKIKPKTFSLKHICEALGLDAKGEMNYSWLDDDKLIDEHWKEIEEYTKQDILITKQLWDKINDFFEPFANTEFLSEWEIKKYKHLTWSIGSYAYHAICRIAGLQVEYDDSATHSGYEGGYVSIPTKEFVKGKIVCLDFNSYYPHIFLMANLYSHSCTCCTPEEKYRGGDLFKINGSYCSKKRGVIESAIKKIYDTRVELKKKKDRREYAYKIVGNTIYGVSASEVFKNVYNFNTASDCTLIARDGIKLARRIFKKYGYDVIYSDTDSVYLIDVFDDENRLMAAKNKIINEIKNNVPFPVDSFDMGIDDRIKMMYFPSLKKKNYLYVTEDDRIVIKGLPFIKSNATPLSGVIFEKYIKPKILENLSVKFTSQEIKGWVREELSKDIMLASVLFRTKNSESYKLDSQIQAQISKKYGNGNHFLIPNLVGLGIGKGKTYCTKEDFLQFNLSLDNINLTKSYKELGIFSETPLKQPVSRIKMSNDSFFVNDKLTNWV